MSKIPFHLVTGFLGSGKTTFLKSFLSQYADKKKIAVIQNEFSETGFDGKELQNSGWRFDLLEVNKGSVFCVCLFSDFRVQLADFVEKHQPQLILLEATGLADPIAISELLMDTKLQQQVYLSQIWTIIDALNYEKVHTLPAVKNQIVIADNIIVNKTDLVDDEKKVVIESEIKRMNPLATIFMTTFSQIEVDEVDSVKSEEIIGKPVGAIKDIRTQVYRTPYAVKRKNIDYLISQLNDEVYRLKGYLMLDNHEAIMIQSVFGKTTLTSVEKTMNNTEIICIGKQALDFEFILRKLVLF